MRESNPTDVMRKFPTQLLVSVDTQFLRRLLPACLMLGFFASERFSVSALAAEEVCRSCSYKVSVIG